jgi:K+-sensing histidine kinase KdpD
MNKEMGIGWQKIHPATALHYFKQSLEAYQKAGNKEEVVNINILIADAYFYMDDYEQQLVYLKKALLNVLELDNAKLEIRILLQLAEVYFHLNNLEMAEKYIQVALEESQNHDRWMPEEIRLTTVSDSTTGNFANTMVSRRQSEQRPSKQQSPEQIQQAADELRQAEWQFLNIQRLALQTTHQGQKKRSDQMNCLLVLLVLTACGGGFVLVRLGRSFRKTMPEKIRLMDDRQLLTEKKNSCSDRHQMLLQKKESLQKTCNDLTDLHRYKTELFKVISNDLHAPLIRLQQTLTHLITHVGEDRFWQVTAELTDSVGDISLLLENLLQWSKHHSQGIRAKPQNTEITALINDAVQQQKYAAAEKRIAISNALQQQVFVYADEDMVKSLLKNILQNIIKLSDADAEISISGDRDAQQGWLQINYTGQMPLKEAFIRQSYTGNYDAETTELGKAISLGWMLCRSLMKANSGDIRVEDVSCDSLKVVFHIRYSSS